MKIKYIAGKKINEVSEVADTEAKSLIEAGVAEEVKVEADPSEELYKALDGRIAAVAEEAYKRGKEETKAEISKGLKKSPAIFVGEDRVSLDPQKGFKCFGEFAKALKEKTISGKSEIFTKAGIAESSDGAAVPVQYATEIFQIVNNSEESLLASVEQIPTTTNHLYLPLDSLVQFGSNAVTGGWVAEGANPNGFKGTGLLSQTSFTLNKYLTLASVTDEMLSDNNVMIESFTTQKAAYDIMYAVNQAIIQGSGTGQPKGILNSTALVTVTADSADEYVSGIDFSWKDVRNMLSHFLKRSGKSSPVWIVNPLCKSAVYGLKDDAGRSLYFAPGTVQNAPTESIAGIPIVWSWHASTFGSKGDIILADLKAYVALVKAEGVQAASSMHLLFDKDTMAYRYTIRLDGKPAINAPFLAPDGATKFSPFVALSDRT